VRRIDASLLTNTSNLAAFPLEVLRNNVQAQGGVAAYEPLALACGKSALPLMGTEIRDVAERTHAPTRRRAPAPCCGGLTGTASAHLSRER
jgi:hypothetical protein